jgi:uncharacterized protein with von Willebrand factor type A (vWA) domain
MRAGRRGRVECPGRDRFITVTKVQRNAVWLNGFDERRSFVTRRGALLSVSPADDEVLELSELLVN